jgi:transposase
VQEGKIVATREAIAGWASTFDGPWCCGLEATICSHWIYQELKRYAAQVQMANPSRLKALSTAKRKNDARDARTLADLLRCNLFPACYVPPGEYESLRCYLRERALLLRARVMFKNKTAGLLIQRGVLYETRKLHHKRYYQALLEEHAAWLDDLKPLLAFNRTQIEQLEQMDNRIIAQLVRDPLLDERIERLKSIDGVGDILALTWAVEVGEPSRFPNERQAISYCGLCAAERESAGVQKRGPLSKQRNAFLPDDADRSGAPGDCIQRETAGHLRYRMPTGAKEPRRARSGAPPGPLAAGHCSPLFRLPPRGGGLSRRFFRHGRSIQRTRFFCR